jgi:hypothetical protein
MKTEAEKSMASKLRMRRNVHRNRKKVLQIQNQRMIKRDKSVEETARTDPELQI